MNSFQQSLYDNLMALVQSNEAFYFQDFQLDNKTYRIFNYRLASYTDFQLPGALECRGVMFEVDEVEKEKAVHLATLPMEKFFNLNENPMTMGLDLTQIDTIEEKVDGSLMSTYIHNDQVRLKSKGSLFSDQAIAAMKWLDTQPLLKEELRFAAFCGNTVNLEWCSPEHRIVLGYPKAHLKILNMRSMLDGFYLTIDNSTVPGLFNVVRQVQTDDPVAFVASIPAMVDVEGYVIKLKSGQRIKVKCEWYLSLHHAKDSVNNPRRLFEAILDEGIDDLRSLFHNDVVAMLIIDQMQDKVDHLYNSMVKAVENYYEANQTLDRKSYAIKGQQELSLKNGNVSYFGLAMNKYSGKAVDYKGFLKSKWKDLGLKDTSLDQTDE